MKIATRRMMTLLGTVAAAGASIATVAATSAVAAPVAAPVNAPESASQNWSGYVASGNSFSSVSGSWTQPTAKCESGQTYSAFWVGLGGASGKQALEQTGTQADCNDSGQTEYYAWYELVPAAPVQMNLAVKPGDHISARVSLAGSQVTIAMSNQTTGQSQTKTLTMNNPDNSSAEWIAEAPSSCTQDGSCQPLPLADFGTVTFSNASATANGHTGPISDSDWNAQPVTLDGGAGLSGYQTDVSYPGASSASAQPSSLASNGSSFSVAYQGDSGASTGVGDGSGGYGDGGGYGYGDGYGDGGYGNGNGYWLGGGGGYALGSSGYYYGY